MNANPTPYPDVNEILNLLLTRVQELLGDQFLGMYLYGSLSSGDFDPASSDIDFLVITTNTLSNQTVSELEVMHQRLWATGLKWASKLEGAYVPKELIRCHNPKGGPCPTVTRDSFMSPGWVVTGSSSGISFESRALCWPGRIQRT